MAHVVKVVEKKNTAAAGQIAVLLRCCADPATDSWHSLIVDQNTTPDTVTSWLDARKADVAALHGAQQAAAGALDAIQI